MQTGYIIKYKRDVTECALMVSSNANTLMKVFDQKRDVYDVKKPLAYETLLF